MRISYWSSDVCSSDLRCVAESGVHEGAVMRRGRIGMDIGPEMRAGDAHALNRDCAARLERADHLGESFEKSGAFPIIEHLDGAQQGIRPDRHFAGQPLT